MAAHLVPDVERSSTFPDSSKGSFQDSLQAVETRRPYTLLFWLLLLAFEAFVLSLPLFPTGDSGLHLYYATIFRDLVTHSSPLYAQFYAIRHVVQPYLLHYYVFIGLCTFLSPDAAEKVLVTVVLASVAFGFRRLVGTLSPRSPGLVFLVFPLLLNWPLAMGGLNYDFALGLLMFALALYHELPPQAAADRRLGYFAGLLLLLVLSHPIPLLLLICILGLDLLLRAWQAPNWATFQASNRSRLLALAFSCVAFVIPMLIADKGQVGKAMSDVHFHREYLKQISNASRLAMFYTPGLLGRLYNKCFFLLYPAALTFVWMSGFFSRLRQRQLSGADRLAIFTLLFLGATLFAPFEMNGSGFFSLRLWFPCWLLGLASCSGALRGRRWNRLAAGYGVVLSMITLGMAEQILRPIAVRSAAIEHAPLPVGKRGLFIQSVSGENAGLLHVNYPVFWWNGGRAFITHHDVMLNSAWLYLTIAPVKENGQSGLMRDYTDRVATENPNSLAFYLNRNPDQQARALRDADFILFDDPRPAGSDVTQVLRLALEPHVGEWRCEVSALYALCTKKTAF